MKAESFIRVSGYGAAGSGVRYVQQDGKWYMVEQSPYECKQIRLGLDVLSDSPYILFNVVMRKSQTPSSSDDDEEDTDDSDAENDEELKDYFVIEFLDVVGQPSFQTVRATNLLPDNIGGFRC